MRRLVLVLSLVLWVGVVWADDPLNCIARGMDYETWVIEGRETTKCVERLKEPPMEPEPQEDFWCEMVPREEGVKECIRCYLHGELVTKACDEEDEEDEEEEEWENRNRIHRL